LLLLYDRSPALAAGALSVTCRTASAPPGLFLKM